MTMIYNQNAKKKATNLSINSDLLQQAKDLKINISSSLEKTLEQIVREKKIASWQEENKDWIDSYNKDVEENGIFSDHVRLF